VCIGCGRIDFAALPDSSANVTQDGPSLSATALVYWKFDGMGSIAQDSVANHPMMLSGPTWSAGVFGGAITADGTSQFGGSVPLDLTGTMAVTVSVWVNRVYTAGPNHTLFELTSNYNSSAGGFGLFPDDSNTCVGGQIMVALNGDVGFNQSCFAQPTSGVWHHLVAIYDKSQPGAQETALYINGVAQSPTRKATSDNHNTFANAPLYLFSRGGTQEFNAGSVDDMMIFTRALSPAEVAQL
jgi:hypothetical protein